MSELNNRKVTGIELVFENLEYVTINEDAIIDIAFDNPHEQIYTSREKNGLVTSSVNYVDLLLLRLDMNKLEGNIDWENTLIYEEVVDEVRPREEKFAEILEHLRSYRDIACFKVLYSDYISENYYVPYNGDMVNEWQSYREFKTDDLNMLSTLVAKTSYEVCDE